ncbi:MAG: NAD(P)H-dependent oxidoreductase [Deltaproteobacteria bacterium]|nr:NAD(P)H-dependent oxidoreductase [Deltaproteobacteria bacterium]
MSLIVFCATNRPGARTRTVAKRVHNFLGELSKGAGGPIVDYLDLANLRPDIFSTDCYSQKPAWFLETFQAPILEAKGLLVCTPEYNGGFPGVMKYFIDMLKFPESLVDLPVAFIGCADGQFGALRAVEQLELIFHYRKAHVYGERLFISKISSVFSADGSVGEYEERLQKLAAGFLSFVNVLKGERAYHGP